MKYNILFGIVAGALMGFLYVWATGGDSSQKLKFAAIGAALGSILFTFIGFNSSAMQGNYQNISASQAEEMLKSDPNVVLIDVRTAGEAAAASIPNTALLADIMSPDFAKKLANLDKEKTYLIYCRSGNRSGSACGYLSQQGYKCYNLAGGIMGWRGQVVSK